MYLLGRLRKALTSRVSLLVLATYASRRPNYRPVGKQKPGRCPVSNIITTCDCRPENIKCRGDQDCPGDININKSVPYRCPGKGYVCGYSRVPRDKQGNVLVKCCTAQGVSYDDSECVRYFRIESPKSLSPTKPGYFVVGSTPYRLSKNKIGFYNVECRFRKVKDQQKKYRR
uniref:Uncharacterized protein n=1 Tax=Magallana gigas TaxID=29159 RepID=K1QWP0_MAGGI